MPLMASMSYVAPTIDTASASRNAGGHAAATVSMLSFSSWGSRAAMVGEPTIWLIAAMSGSKSRYSDTAFWTSYAASFGMSLTVRPQTPPALLRSSQYIFWVWVNAVASG